MVRKTNLIRCPKKQPTPKASTPQLHKQQCGFVFWNFHQNRNCVEVTDRWEDHVETTVMHCMPQKGWSPRAARASSA